MVLACCVKGCNSENYPGCNISFHRFPANEVMRQRWLLAMGVNSDYRYDNKRICARHFPVDSFLPSYSKAKLKTDAVPKIVVSDIQVPQEFGSGVFWIELSTPPSESSEPPSESPEPPSEWSEPPTEWSEPPTKIVRPIITNVGTQTLILPSPKEEILKKKVKSLQEKLKRRDIKIKKIKSLLAAVKNFSEIENVLNNFDNIYKIKKGKGQNPPQEKKLGKKKLNHKKKN